MNKYSNLLYPGYKYVQKKELNNVHKNKKKIFYFTCESYSFLSNVYIYKK